MNTDTSQALFQNEYQQELETWLRRRFGWLCAVYLALDLLIIVLMVLAAVLTIKRPGTEPIWSTPRIVDLAARGLAMAIVAHFFFRLRPRVEERDGVVALATRMILGLGALSILSQLATDGIAGEWSSSMSGHLLWSLFFWHFSACLILPWTPRESLRALIPLLIACDAYVILGHVRADPVGVLLTVILNPLILIPGLALCAWRLRQHRHSFRTTMVGRHFTSMRRELTHARRLHESMFPAPYDDGFVRFEYTYTPMRDLGGDFIHLHVGGEGLVHLTLVDVTGHGLAAALTVSRLYGELERLRAESPQIEPEEVIRSLNQYVHLTLARHSIFATALCMTIDPYAGRLIWANAGHPPAFRRGANGVVTPLDSTAMMLGPLPRHDYPAEQQSLDLTPGDVLLAYTDGVIEARNRQGRQFGIEPLRQLLMQHPAPRNWSQYVATQVGKHAGGRSEDDVLVATLSVLAYRREPAPTSATRESTTV